MEFLEIEDLGLVDLGLGAKFLVCITWFGDLHDNDLWDISRFSGVKFCDFDLSGVVRVFG